MLNRTHFWRKPMHLEEQREQRWNQWERYFGWWFLHFKFDKVEATYFFDHLSMFMMLCSSNCERSVMAQFMQTCHMQPLLLCLVHFYILFFHLCRLHLHQLAAIFILKAASDTCPGNLKNLLTFLPRAFVVLFKVSKLSFLLSFEFDW